MLRLLKVSGQSLTPAIQEGDFVIISKIPFIFSPPKTGDIIAFRHPAYGIMVKIIQSIDPAAQQIVVTGSHPESVDSRDFGPIPARQVLGKLVWHIRKPG